MHIQCKRLMNFFGRFFWPGLEIEGPAALFVVVSVVANKQN